MGTFLSEKCHAAADLARSQTSDGSVWSLGTSQIKINGDFVLGFNGSSLKGLMESFNDCYDTSAA